MLMRNPEYQFENVQECRRHFVESLVVYTTREMVLGQLILMLLFAIAIVMRAMA